MATATSPGLEDVEWPVIEPEGHDEVVDGRRGDEPPLDVYEILGEGDVLDGGVVLPGFRHCLADFFELRGGGPAPIA